MRHTIGTLVLLATLGVAPAAAQKPGGELHGNYSRTTGTHTQSWGAGTLFAVTLGGKAPLNANTSLGLDYLKQEKGGPGEVTVSYDAVLQPGGNSTVTPYAGGSVGANWSTGDQKAWNGAKLGLETIGGVQVKVGTSGVAWKLEERFGYVRGQEHTLTTRLGVVFSK